MSVDEPDRSAVDGYRVEHDSMGEVFVPSASRWGAQTQRAIENFPISGERIASELIRALAMIKRACATVNLEYGVIGGEVAAAIAASATEIAAGAHLDEFPVDVFQTGSGTSSNMNMNEVIANMAGEALGRQISPNDEVNATQSSNDTFPTAIHLAAAMTVQEHLLPALDHLEQALSAKASEFADVVKAGRTHLMDATPVTLGQEFAGYAMSIQIGVERLGAALPRIWELPLGGTAVGTGLNAPAGFAARVIAELSSLTGLALREARNHFEAQGGRDALVELSGVVRTIAVSMYKIANDLRWMASGPRSGLGEIQLPDLQPGSSIMPGKVNPVVPEAVCQVVAQVIGNDAAVVFGGAAGNFELNVMMPVIARNLLESIRLLGNVATALADKCVVGITADVEKCLSYARSSSAIVTALNPVIGYEKAGLVVRKASEQGSDLRSVVLAMGLLSEEETDAVLDVLAMTRGGRFTPTTD